MRYARYYKKHTKTRSLGLKYAPLVKLPGFVSNIFASDTK